MNPSGDSRETELQTLLRDERDRCNQHKHIYQSLKEKHEKLQEELALVYDQLKEATSLNERSKQSNETTIRKLQTKLNDLQKENCSLQDKLKTYDEKKIQAAVFEETALHYEAKIKELNEEADKVHDQYSNLHYENAILKCKFDSREAEYSRSLERINLQHKNEVDQLRNKIELLEKKDALPSETYAVELKSSKREILQLNSKIKALLAECDELRAQNENLTLQLSSLQRSNSKQIADNVTNLRILESEKLKAVTQTELVEKELINAQEHRKVLNNELQASRREIILLQGKVDDCEHKCRMTVANLQLDMEQWKASKESEAEQLYDKISKLNLELHNSTTNFTKERQSMTAKQQDLEQSLAAAKQQLWKQSREMQEEKEIWEQKMRKSEEEKDGFINQLKLDIQVLKQKLHMCSDSKADLEKELQALRNSGGRMSNLNTQTKEILSSQNNYQKEIQELREKIDLLSAGTIPLLKEEKHGVMMHTEHEVMDLKLGWEQQKLQFRQRLEELESQLRELKSTSIAEKREFEFKIKQYSHQVIKLRDKLEQQKTQNEELENEKEMLEKNVPVAVHQQVKNQLTDLKRRLEEYQLLMYADPNSTSKLITSTPLPDKLLMDIKNIQQQSSAAPSQVSLDRTTLAQSTVPDSSPKKTTHRRRKSIKSKERKPQSKNYSPNLSSSSDIDLENL